MKRIKVKQLIDKPVEETWTYWTTPEHIIHWNFASPEWHCPSAVNDLNEGGKFNWRMEAKDGSMGFDYSGSYDRIIPYESISLTIDDGRKVDIYFTESDGVTEIVEEFEPDGNDQELQRQGWQAILDNFKNYSERTH